MYEGCSGRCCAGARGCRRGRCACLAPGYYGYLLGTLATTALVGVGLNVLLGLAGEVSLGQGGFLALGAYGVGVLTTKAGLDFWEALPLAVLLVAAISAVLSIPALRVTGPYLAMVTIAFGFIVESVSIEWRDLTGGASGLSRHSGSVRHRRHGAACLRLLRAGAGRVSSLRAQSAGACDAGDCVGAGGRAQHRHRPAAGAHRRLRAGGVDRRARRRIAGGADRLHRAELVSVLAVDPVSAGRRASAAPAGRSAR